MSQKTTANQSSDSARRSVTRRSGQTGRSVEKTRRSGFSPAAPISRLQQSAGNRALQRFFKTNGFQPKLTVSQPGDKFEKEADQTAALVMRMADHDLINCKPADEDDTVQRKADEEEPVKRKATDEEEKPVQRKATDEEDSVHLKSSGPGVSTAPTNLVPGGGQPLPQSTRRFFEPRFGRDFSHVRIHDGTQAAENARSLQAQAYTRGSDIVFGSGSYNPGTHSGKQLLAHELTHVVQQGKAGDSGHVHRKAEAPSEKSTEQPLAGDMELKGKAMVSDSDEAAAGFLERKNAKGKKLSKAMIMVHYGKLARGLIQVNRDGKRYTIKKQFIPLNHPLFSRLAAAAPDLTPGLVLDTEGKKIKGYIGLKPQGAKNAPKNDLRNMIQKMPDLIGLTGFELPKVPKISNKLEGGLISIGISNVPINLGGVFNGNFGLEANETTVTKFEGNASIKIGGLMDGDLNLKRDEKGVISGKTALAVQMPKNVSGNVEIEWKGSEISGMGKVGYQGEKLGGSITVRVMEKNKALALEQLKKAPPEGVAAAPAVKKKKSKKPEKTEYAVFGEGDLNFAFTDWLNGTAHVILDPKGFVTIIGKITPQKEFELFPQKDFNKELFKVEARASYGVPVVGNIFIFANLGMSAFANLGPGKIYNIQVDGTYSTDPGKAMDFSIRCSLNVSAAAGLKLRAEAGAGLEIMDHDIKAGAGINGIAALKGYAEATPIIGYREKVGPTGEDKKGEFFIRGEMEIAAQPVLGLSGDVFVELDSPWWSPAPDKKWVWPLFNKEWPVGGSLGIGADIDYVFGSGTWPSVKFKPVDFNAAKFTSDMYSDKAKSKSGKGGDKPGKWKEKNSKAAAPPAKTAKGGDAKPGKAADKPAASSAKSAAKGKKIKGKKADANARTAEGKSVKQLQAEAARKGKKPQGQDLKGGKGQPNPKKAGKDPLAAKDTADSKKVKAAVKNALKGKRFTSKAQTQKLLSNIYNKYSSQGLKGIQIVDDPKVIGKVGVSISASVPDIVYNDTLSRQDLEKLAMRYKSVGNPQTNLFVSFDQSKILWRPPGGKPFINTNQKNVKKHAEENFLKKLPKLIDEINRQRSAGKLTTPAGQPVPVYLDLNRLPCGADHHNCTQQLIDAGQLYKNEIKFVVRASSAWKQTGISKDHPVVMTDETQIKKLLAAGIDVQPLHIWDLLKKKLMQSPPAGFDTKFPAEFLNLKVGGGGWGTDAHQVEDMIKRAAADLNMIWKLEAQVEEAEVGSQVGGSAKPPMRRKGKK